MSSAGQQIRSAIAVADGVITASPGQFYGVYVSAAGAVILYDNASAASGTKIFQGEGPGGIYFGGDSVPFRNGIYADITANAVTVLFNN